MPRRRPPALFLLLSAGIAAALTGCARRTVAPTPDAVAVDSDPAPHSAAASTDGPPFQFPNDAGGKLLSKTLTPSDAPAAPDAPGAGPRRPSPPTGITAPLLPPPPDLPPPAPAERARKPVEPRPVAEESLGLDRADPEPPQPRSFAVGDRIRRPSADVNQPPPLPILAQPTADRAPLDDPTAEASTTAALAAAMPQRTTPAPYARVELPDPFANRQTLRLPVPPDDGNPRTGTVHPPKP